MKKKILIFSLVFVLVVAGALGMYFFLFYRGEPYEPPKIEPDITVGETVKKLMNPQMKGVTASLSWGDLSVNGNYSEKSFDYAEKDYYPTTFQKTYYRNGRWFIRQNMGYPDDDATWDDIVFRHLEYENCERSFTEPNIRAASYGYALMLSVYENAMAYSNKKTEARYEGWSYDYSDMLYQIPEDGLWTGEVPLAGGSGYTSMILDSSWDWEFSGWSSDNYTPMQAIRAMPFFKFAAAPFTEEQMVELFTAFATLDDPFGELSAQILEHGKPTDGQSAYDYLMGAFEGIYGNTDETFTYEFCGSLLDPWYLLPKASLMLTLGHCINYDSYFTAIFNEQGGLIGIKGGANEDDFENLINNIEFTDTTETENIDDEEVIYQTYVFNEETTCTTSSNEGIEVKFGMKDGTIEKVLSLSFEGIPDITVGETGKFTYADSIEELDYSDSDTVAAPLSLTLGSKKIDAYIAYNGTVGIYWDILITCGEMKEILEELQWDVPPEWDEKESDEYVYFAYGSIEPNSIIHYKSSVSEFAEKPLAEVPHKETIKTSTFYDLMWKKFGYYFSSMENCKITYYVDGEAVESYTYYQDMVIHTMGTDENGVPDSGSIWYREEQDGYWAYKNTYQAGWRQEYDTKYWKMHVERPDFVENPIKYLQAAYDYKEVYEFYDAITKEGDTIFFELDGHIFRMDLEDGTFTTEWNGEQAVLEVEEARVYMPSNDWFDQAQEVYTEALTEERWQSVIEQYIQANSITFEDSRENTTMFDFAQKTAYVNGNYYKVQNGVVMEYIELNGSWVKQESTYTEQEIFNYPLLALADVPYADLTYDPFDDMFYIILDDMLYGIHIKTNGSSAYARLDYFFTEAVGSYTEKEYFVSDLNSTTIRFPEIRLSEEQVVQAINDTFSASSYDVSIEHKLTKTIVHERFDFTNKITSAELKNSAGDTLAKFLRAVTEGKVYMYSDASGAWLRAQIQGNPDTYMQTASKLSEFKAAWDASKGYSSLQYSSTTYEYTLGKFKITFEDGYIATLRNTMTNMTATFTEYNAVTLSLPTLGHVDEAVRQRFMEGLTNSMTATTFHAEWTLDNAFYSSDVEQGKRAYTLGYYQNIPMMKMYREYANGTLSLWTSMIDPMSSEFAPSWDDWEKQTMPEDATALRTDMYLQNIVNIITGGNDPSLLFILAKYDAATDSYIIRDYNFLEGELIEYSIKIEDGYVTQWTLVHGNAGPDVEEGLTIYYSQYNTATVSKPQDIVG